MMKEAEIAEATKDMHWPTIDTMVLLLTLSSDDLNAGPSSALVLSVSCSRQHGDDLRAEPDGTARMGAVTTLGAGSRAVHWSQL